MYQTLALSLRLRVVFVTTTCTCHIWDAFTVKKSRGKSACHKPKLSHPSLLGLSLPLSNCGSNVRSVVGRVGVGEETDSRPKVEEGDQQGRPTCTGWWPLHLPPPAHFSPTPTLPTTDLAFESKLERRKGKLCKNGCLSRRPSTSPTPSASKNWWVQTLILTLRGKFEWLIWWIHCFRNFPFRKINNSMM